MYPASRLLRQILTLNHEVEKELGRRLGVNLTDLTAMEHLISSGPLSPTDIADRLGVSTAATTGAIDRLVKAGHGLSVWNRTASKADPLAQIGAAVHFLDVGGIPAIGGGC